MVFAILWGYRSYDRNFNPEWLAGGWNPGGNVGANFRTYRYAAELAREGQSFYGVAPPGLADWAVYLYPPITVTAYYPFTGIEWLTGYWLLVGLNALAGIGVAAAIVRYLDRFDRRLGWVDTALIVGLVLASPFTFGTIYYGNINLLVAAAFVGGLLALDDDREVVAGAAFGLAALFKLFPALVGVWLLRRRSWRSIATATAVGVGGILAGVVAYGREATVTFFSDVVINRAETAAFAGGYPVDSTFYVTIQRPLSHLLWGAFPDAPPELLTPLAGLTAVAILAVFYVDIETRQDRLLAVFATLVVTVTAVPALQWYLVLLFFPMVPLWYVWEGPGRRLFLTGGAVLFANEPPGGVVWGINEYGVPTPLKPTLVDIATVASVPLYGIAIMLVACALAKYGIRPDTIALRALKRVREAVSTRRSGP
jgi:hypothetical protein